MDDFNCSNDINHTLKSKLNTITKQNTKTKQPIISKLEYHSSNKNKKIKEKKTRTTNLKYKMKCLKNCIYIFENYRKKNELFKKNLKLLLSKLFEELYLKNTWFSDPNSLKNIINLNIQKNPQIKFQNEYINSNSNNKYNLIINTNAPVIKHKRKFLNNILKKSKKSNSSSFNNNSCKNKKENKKKNINLDDILGYASFRNRATVGKLNNSIKINNLLYNNEKNPKNNSLLKNYNNNFYNKKNLNKQNTNASRNNNFKETADNSLNNNKNKQFSETKLNSAKKIIYFKGLHKNRTKFPNYKKTLKSDFSISNDSATNEELNDISHSLKKKNSFLTNNNYFDMIKTNRSDKEIIIGDINNYFHNINKNCMKNNMNSCKNKLTDSITLIKNNNQHTQRMLIKKNFAKENFYKENSTSKRIIYEKHAPNKNNKNIKKNTINNLNTKTDYSMENKINI